MHATILHFIENISDVNFNANVQDLNRNLCKKKVPGSTAEIKLEKMRHSVAESCSSFNTNCPSSLVVLVTNGPRTPEVRVDHGILQMERLNGNTTWMVFIQTQKKNTFVLIN